MLYQHNQWSFYLIIIYNDLSIYIFFLNINNNALDTTMSPKLKD